MKTVRRIYTWIIISVIAQILIIAYFNYVYLPGRGKVVVTSAGVVEKQKEDVQFKIPHGADQIRVSFDGQYAGYVYNDKLEIFDIQNKKSVTSINSNGDKISYFRWLPDRNILIYSLIGSTSKSGNIQIITYDVQASNETKYDEIKNVDKNSEVTDIELSPLTNIVYAFIKMGDSQAKVYQFDIMSKIRAIIPMKPDNLIKETNYSDKLVYQDNKNKMYVRDGIKSSTWPFPFKNKMALLDIDNEDKVYAGEINNENMVTKIHFGKLSVEPDKAWTITNLKTPVLPENLLITRDGVIYELDSSQNTINSISDNKKIKFKGKFIEMLDDYIVSLNNDELELTVVD